MADLPKCRNAVKNGDHESDMRLKSETDGAWVFQCRICELVQVISKEGVANKSKFEQARKRFQQESERLRMLDSRKKFFTSR